MWEGHFWPHKMILELYMLDVHCWPWLKGEYEQSKEHHGFLIQIDLSLTIHCRITPVDQPC